MAAFESGSTLSTSSLPTIVKQYTPYVTSPYPAYGLASLFLASTPFTFLQSEAHVKDRVPPLTPGSPLQEAIKSKPAGKFARQAFNTRTGLPPAYQVVGFAGLIGLGGYGIQSGDVLNGTGVVTGWSLMYLAFYSLRTLKSKHPVSISLTASTALIGGLHAAYYFDRTSWQGAFPGMASGKDTSSSDSKGPVFSLSSAAGQQAPLQQQSSVALALLAVASGTAFRARRPATSSNFSNMFKCNLSSAPTAPSPSKASRFVRSIDPSTIPKGFAVSSAYAGIKAAISPKPVPDASVSATSSAANQAAAKPDLALIVSTTETPAAAAGTFTRNVFKAAPVVLSSQILLSNGSRARSILVNSGCANAVTGQRGLDDARRCGSEVGALLKRSQHETLLLSTGVIGVPLPMDAISKKLPSLASSLKTEDAQEWHETSRAFMTTDTFPKLRTRTFKLGQNEYRMLGIDKGAGMIHPSMAGPTATMGGLHATLLGFVATDAPISPPALQSALDYAVQRSFNCISVDGDMSTNDTIIALANGAAAKAGQEEISADSHPQEFGAFREELRSFCTELAQLIVRDGEGAEKFVEITVKNAPSHAHAHSIASTISTSALVKCALHGGDANWGRILCAVGYAPLPVSMPETSGWNIDPSKVTVKFLPPSSAASSGDFKALTVLDNGTPQAVDEAEAARLLALEDIVVEVDLKGGLWANGQGESNESATYWTCDFSKEYVAINGDYRS